MMGAIGTGNVRDGVVTASLGTSGTLYACTRRPAIDPTGEIAAFCDSTGKWLPLACTMSVTVATEMVRANFFARRGFKVFDSVVSQIQPGSDGLMLLPYLEGERLPNVPEGTGVLLGLRPATATKPHLARASMEGVTLGLRYGLDRMRSVGISPKEIRLIGGGSRSPVWRQIVADIFEMPVARVATDEGAALGAALQACWVWGCERASSQSIQEIASQHVAVDPQTVATPEPAQKERYAELYDLYLKLSRLFTGDYGPQSTFSRHRRFIEKWAVDSKRR